MVPHTGISVVDKLNAHFWERFRAGRAVAFKRDGRLLAILSFVLVKDVADAKRIYERPSLAGVLDIPHGAVCYIEKLMGEVWSRELFRWAQEAILERYPHIKLGVWFRPTTGSDRQVVYNPHDKRIALHAY